MKDVNLKPCPICGGEAYITKWLHGFWPTAKHRPPCPLNDMRLPECVAYVTENDAARAWNMRKGE